MIPSGSSGCGGAKAQSANAQQREQEFLFFGCLSSSRKSGKRGNTREEWFSRLVLGSTDLELWILLRRLPSTCEWSKPRHSLYPSVLSFEFTFSRISVGLFSTGACSLCSRGPHTAQIPSLAQQESALNPKLFKIKN